MGHPISSAYLDIQEARVSAALPAAGAWDATPTELSCAQFSFVTLYTSYTRGAVGGVMDFYVDTSPYSADQAGVENWFRQTILAGGAVALNADTTSLTQRELVSYGATAAAIENLVYGPIELRGTVERIRILCRESGAAANPGTVHIMAVFACDAPN